MSTRVFSFLIYGIIYLRGHWYSYVHEQQVSSKKQLLLVDTAYHRSPDNSL